MKKVNLNFLFIIFGLFSLNLVFASTKWTKLPLSGGEISEVVRFPSKPKILLCGVLNKGLYISRDGAKSWVNVLDFPIRDISIIEDSIAYVATTNGVYISKDFGTEWNKVLGFNSWQVVSSSGGIVVADTMTKARRYYNPEGRGPWLISYNYGLDWQGWEGTSHARIWNSISFEKYEKRGSVLFHSDGTVYLSEGSVLFKTTDNTWTNWEKIKSFEYTYLYFASDAESDATFYGHSIYHDYHPVGFIAGGVYQSNNKGEDWDALLNYSTTALSENSASLFLGTSNGKVFTYDKTSKEITEMDDLGGYVTSIEITSWDVGEIIVTTLGGVFISKDFGESWQKSDKGIYHLETVAVQVCQLSYNSQRILVSTKNSGIWFSDDLGENWQLSDANIKTVPALLQVAPSDDNTLYSAGSTIYVSHDAGTSWEKSENFPAAYYGWYGRSQDLDIDPTDANKLIVNFSDHSRDDYRGVIFAQGEVGYANEWDWQTYYWFSDNYNASYKSQYYYEKGWLLISRKSYWPGVFLTVVDSKSLEFVNEIILPDSNTADIWAAEGNKIIAYSSRKDSIWYTEDFGNSWQATFMDIEYARYDDENIDHKIGEFVFSYYDSLIYFFYPGNGILLSYDGLTWEKDNGISTETVYQLSYSWSDKTRYLATSDGIYTDALYTVLPENGEERSVESFALSQNYPNPFNPSTIINYELRIMNEVKLVVYDVLGREVKTLVDETQQAGKYKVTFNAVNLASGVYYYKLKAGKQFEKTRKMLLLR
jgi:photosystem II stability/assembly factor-like uncharacterized protein